MLDTYKKLNDKLDAKAGKFEARMLPKFAKLVVVDYLGQKALTASYAALNLAFLFKFAQAVSLYRPTVKWGDDDIFINFYGLLIAPSGNYKDLSLRLLNKSMMVPYYQRFEELHNTYMIMQAQKVLQEAEEKFEKSKAQRELYIETHKPRTILTEGSNGTVQGWHSQREAISKTSFGAANYINGEFGDILERYNEADAVILTYLKESFDGETQAIVIKGEKSLSAVKNVPSNMFAHSPLSSVLSPKAKNNLVKYLNSGLARRTFICFEPQKANRVLVDQVGLDVETYYSLIEEKQKEIDKLHPQITAGMEEILNFVKRNPSLELTKGARIKLMIYRDACAVKSENMDLLINEGMSAEIDSRWFKVLKLSALLALCDMSEKITETHIVKAMLQTQYYSKYTIDLFNANTPDSTYRVFEFLRSHLGQSFTTNELVKGTRVSKSLFAKERESLIQELQALAQENFLDLKYIRNKNSYIYSMVEMAAGDYIQALEDNLKIKRVLSSN